MGECALTAAYLINRTPTPLLGGKTPYEILYRKRPCFDNIKVLGCLCYAQSKERPKDKFGERGKRCIFIGYPHSKKGWKVYDLSEKWIFVSRDVVFYENVSPYLLLTKDSDTLNQVDNTLLLDKIFIDYEHIDDPSHEERGNHERKAETGGENGETMVVDGGTGDDVEEERESGGETGSPTEGTDEERMGRGAREKFEPMWKKDYYCKSMKIIAPVSTAQPEKSTSSSSGTRYPLSKYVVTNFLSSSHKAFLAKIDAEKEPMNYREAAQSK